MVNKVRTLDFLPEVFKTKTNSQFLRGTLDVLTSQPDLRAVQGFIGQKYGYSIEPQDRYVVEPTRARADYQLDPSVIFLRPQTQSAQDFISYTGIVQAINNNGGVTARNDRLFDNQFYSWDPFVDLDKLVNFAQYYWIPNGPDAVPISTEQIYLQQGYIVTDSQNGYQFEGVSGTNPVITLIRGGTYSFYVSGPDQFWIQGVPSQSGYAPGSNISTRDILGVTNNGSTNGVVTFTVPAQDAQDQYTQLPGNNVVDVVTSLQFADINGQSLSTIGQIDGIVLTTGKTLMFWNNNDPGTQTNFYTVTVTSGTVTLSPAATIPNNEKITVLSGVEYSGRTFFRSGAGAITLVPYISSILDTLYYRSGQEALSVGKIRIVDSNSANNLDVADIVGQKNYVSPNGVTFTNGLKVVFQGRVVPDTYAGQQYYVEGVGESIRLLPVDEYLAPEIVGEGIYNPWSLEAWDTTVYDSQLFVPTNPEYLTINRDSRDRNAWSRANRWFHQNVLNETTSALGYVTRSPINTVTRAQRPIVEFRGNLRLFDNGTDFLGFVTLVAGDNITDAFSQIVGQTQTTAPLVDGQTLRTGDRVIFPYDSDPAVRAHIYSVNMVPAGSGMVYALSAEETATDLGIVTAFYGENNSGSSWWWTSDTQVWARAQQKSNTNQAPLYNIFNSSGISLSNNAFYESTSFQGTELFSYATGTGQNDPVLGFPIKYTSASTLGDIEFTVNLNSDTFTYSTSQAINATDNINVGFVHYSPEPGVVENLTGWVTAVGESYQSQVFEFPVTDITQSVFTCDIPAQTNSVWNSVQVYYNDNLLTQADFTAVVNNDSMTTAVTLAAPAVSGDKVTILIISDTASKTAYYTVPSNLQNNPFNTNIETVSVGDLKNQYRSIFGNLSDAQGKIFGDNNYHDLGNVNKYGTAIIQNSASLVLPGVFLRKSEADIFNSLQFNSEQYSIYKQLVIDLAFEGDYSVYQLTSQILDNVLYEITKVKSGTTAFFWSDMLPTGSPYITNTYNFAANATTATFQLSQTYDFASANYNGLLIYLLRNVDGRQVSTQLIFGQDYVVSDTSPAVTVNYSIQAGDQIVINEYNQTYGSFCPNTPSKLGLYPAWVPQVVLDTSYTRPTYFIQGHDGSYNKLYGNYDPNTGLLDDFRDSVLLEFETRIYNNIKVSGAIPLGATNVIPGQFRETQYSRQEVLDIYSPQFLNWVGTNRIDYKTQVYNIANQFTYNYNQSADVLNNQQLLQGYWRGLYNWFYDCDNPAQFPWQMLGLTSEPSWWTGHYGPAPYTSDNTYMWQDIAQGLVWNDGAPYVVPGRQRPELLSCLPVNGAGELVSPMNSVVGLYNRMTFQRDWVVGDGAPAESSYLKSSTWPFDLMRLLALTKPAKFFNLFADRDLYKYDPELGQYLYNSRYHLDPRTLEIYGNGVSKNSYINWVVDYNNQRGATGYTVIKSLLENLDVRLTYNVAGFTSKEYLRFLTETATPNSRNTNLLIPDESYQLLLYNNVPSDHVDYSSITVQKTDRGWTVWGNSQNRQYFTVLQPRPGSYYNISAGTVTVQVSNEYDPNRTSILPYGTLFYSLQAVSEFIIDYGRYLTVQGVSFDNMMSGVVCDWQRMVQEFLLWAQQDWEAGSVINLNPNAKIFTVDRPGLVVQPLTIQQRNFILNQNLLPLQDQDIAVVRENTAFQVSVLTDGDTVGYTSLDLSSIEHAVIFDNYTVFNDTIYNLVTGLRQPRLLMQGYKTGNWQGYMDTSGFILNEDNVREWQPNVKYPKGAIVQYKDFYWTAVRLIEPTAEFSTQDWLKTDYNQVKTGLLPNPSTAAYESLYYYDTNRANLELDADLLSYSLIGFRPRQYLADADLSDTTQVNVYKNIVKEKGTNLIANGFKQAELVQGRIDYDIKENWAIKNGEFGGVLNNNFVEFRLFQDQLPGNPTLIGFSSTGDVADVQQTVLLSQLTNWERPPRSSNILPAYVQGYSAERGLPSAGYVNLSDAKLQEFVFEDLATDTTNITKLYRNDIVWLANHQAQWNVYTAQAMNNTVIALENLLDGYATITFSKPHGLQKQDLVAITNFDSRVDNFYRVNQIISDYVILISIVLPGTVTQLAGAGAAFKLVSRRFAQPSDAAGAYLPYTAWQTRLIWADSDTDREWAVYAASPVLRQQTVIGAETASHSGLSVAYSTEMGTISIDGQGNLYRNNQLQTIAGGVGSSSQVAIAGSVLYVMSATEGKIYSYTLSSSGAWTAYASPVTVANPVSMTASTDNLWLYVGSAPANTVSVFALKRSNQTYVLVNNLTYPGTQNASSAGWALSTSTCRDGSKLIVGAPYETVGQITQGGAAYAYSRYTQRYLANGSQTAFTLAYSLPSNPALINNVYVYINDVLTTSGYTFTGSVLTFNTPPADGAVVSISTGLMLYQQRFQSSAPQQGSLFGISTDTNRYGAELVMGAPFERSLDQTQHGVEGAVYRFTNSGLRYGTIRAQVTGTSTGKILLDGYAVSYSGTATNIVAQINAQTPPNITCALDAGSATEFTISVTLGSPETPYNILDITGTAADVSGLGITTWTQTQVIRDPDDSQLAQFGSHVRMNEQDGLCISAPTATRLSPATFDLTNNCIQDDTIFDNDGTFFIDQFSNTGVAYVYEYLPADQESIYNAGQYAFGQYVSAAQTTDRNLQSRFGTSIAYSQGVVVVGAPGYFANGRGLVAQFNTNWTPADPCEVNKPTTWYLDKKPLPQVDINSLNGVNIYDNQSNITLEWLDYIDPVQGKLFGAVQTNLDYMSLTDPASYGDSSITWGAEFVGKTWLDLNTIRMLNYNQPDLVYNASNWGRAFPGSTADIYTWVESTTEPLSYTGAGFPVQFDRYVAINSLDGSTNSIVTKYYFWVKFYDQVPAGKTLSPVTLTQYLLNPLSSGIAYLSPLTPSVIALNNSQEYIQAYTSSLHMGFRTGGGQDDKHTSWCLIRENEAEDFLTGYAPGLPPTGQYLKFIESFVGSDAAGNPVPDPGLPLLVRYGTNFRPRQSMFVDRVEALQNYLEYANNIIINYPIAESKNLGFLQKTGLGYDTPDYWQYVDWWAPGYDASTKPVLELANYTELQTITDNQLIVGQEGLSIAIEDGLIVKIAANSNSNSEYYVYNTDTGWVRIGLTNGTIQFLSKIWAGPFGWNVNSYDSAGWDEYPTVEIYWIIRWLNEYCYTNDLDIYRNSSLIMMFEYIQSSALEQQNYLPWLNKTSLIDVTHKVRDLLPYKKFQRDNQEFLAGYLNEIKPFHVYIKDFVFSYTGQDTYLGDVTDFDLPARYMADPGTFETPRLVYQPTVQADEYTPDATIWQNPLYNQWFQNYGLSVSNAELGLTQVSTLVNYMTGQSKQVLLKNSRGLPYVGAIMIGQELITYEGIDYVNNSLLGIERGADGTTVTEHLPGAGVSCYLPSVVVLDPGRAYQDPPQVSAYIDLAIYPAPREAAQLRPIMAADRVIGIEVINPGSGYAVRPEIYITSSQESQFSSSAVNPVDNVIQIPSHPFQTGDSVLYIASTGSTSPAGLTSGAYYYVRSLDTNNVALYTDYQNCVQQTEIATNDGRVQLYTQGSGNFTLGICAQAVCFTSGMPVREFGISLRFDRVSYTSSVSDWQSGICYAGIYDNAASTSASGMPASSSNRSSAGGVVVNITGAQADVDGNVQLTVNYTGAAPAQIDGQQLQLYTDTGSAWTNDTTYYWRVMTPSTVRLYHDALFNYPVTFAEYDTSLNLAFLDNPFYFERSLVMYGGQLWRCTVSNCDAEFDPTKWELVSSNDPALTAADRVMAFYRPTPSMPGRDLRQLMQGVQYPNATFQGAVFGEEQEPYGLLPWDVKGWDSDDNLASKLDTLLQAPDFAYDPLTNPTQYDVQGGAFAQGYGPEELVPGVLTDGLNFNVTTKPGTTWELGGAEGWQEGFYGDGRWSPDLYDHSGFNVFQFDATVDENNEISFDQLVVNPVTLAMFAQTSTPTDDFAQQFRVPDIADNYTVDWVRKVITINEAYLQTVTLTVVLYEFGNGNQFVRSNNSCMPLRDMGDHSEIYLDVTFAEITPPSLSNFYGTASVYVNGVRIPYQGEVAGATEWYTVEPEQNGVNTRLVFNSLYDNDTHYVTFVLNGGTSGVSVPQTQTITINNPYVLTYDLDYFVGDNNVDNVIVEWNGLRLYNTLPNTVVTYSTPLISGYGVPISSTDIPLFNPAGVNVSVAGTPVTTAVYTTNWDPVTLSASGLDGEWNSQYGYLDIGVPINGSSLYVVFEPSYWSGVALGEQVEIVYSATVIGAPYTISVDGDGRGQITLNSALGIAAGDTITVTTFNRDDQQSLVTQAFVALTVTEIVATNTVSGLTTVTTMNVHNLANQDQVTIDTRDSSWTTGAYVRVVSPTEVELYTDYNLTVPLAYNGSYTGSDGYIWRTQDLELDQPEYRLYDTTRLWATLDNILDSTGGFHLDHTILRLYNNVVTGGPSATVIPNVLGVLTEISTTNQLVVLSMAPAANPNALSFRLNVTAAGAGSVWRTNCFTQTYLTETTYSTGRFDDVLHVHDASRLVETHTFTVTPDAQSVFRVGEFAANQVTGIVIVDALDNHITDYAINAAEVAGTEYTTNRNISLDITVQESYTGPLTVTVAVGNKLIVQSEQIQFTSIDLVNNTVTGLLRGRNGTITNTVFEKYSTVQSMLDRDQMSAQDYTVNWYDEYAPLQLNVTPQALFLQQQNP